MDNLQEQLKNIMTESLTSHLTRIQMETNHFSENYVCPKCLNTGWVLVEDEGQGKAIECDCGIRKKRIHNSKMQFANIPESFRDVRLSNFQKNVYHLPESRQQVIEIAKAIKYWLENLESMKERGIGLYFYSATKGSGKTRLAASIANELIEKYNTQVKFATSLQILDELKKSWNDVEEPESSLLQDLTSTEVLIIDDFGVENQKQWINEKFYSIINGRYVNKKITICTSNMSLDDLKYDDRITNRLKERVLQIPFPEESVREWIAEALKEELIKGCNK